MIREKDIEAYLVRQVARAGGISFKFTSPGRVGVPDRLCILNGAVLFVEVKAPGKKPTAIQERMMELLADHGANVTWVDSAEAVDQELRHYA